MAALDQVTVEYNANIGKLQSDLAGAEAAFRKTDQAASQSANKITGAFQKTGGIVENLNAHLKSLEARRDKAMNPAIIQVFNKRIDETRAKIQALTRQVDKSGQSMALTFKNIAASVGIAFGTQQLIQFGKELIKVALDAEEVKTAFNNLNNPQLLGNLRDAVSGTVDDVTLMKQALKAENLGIPVQQLATAFEFAERRAGALGLSTEQLIENIVQGIGAKSTKAFTSMGIDALRVQDALKGMNAETAEIGDIAAAMGTIFREELDKLGESVDSNSDKVERMQAQWKDFKVALGTGLVSILVGVREAFLNLGDAVTDTTDSLLGSQTIIGGIAQSLLEAADPFNIFHQSIKDGANERRGYAAQWEEVDQTIKKTIPTVGQLQQKLDDINKLIINGNISQAKRNNLLAHARRLDEEIKLALGQETEAMKAHRAEIEKNRQEYEKWLEVQREIAKERERQELILDPKESIIPVTNALDEMTEGVNNLLSGLKTLAEEGGLDATLIENRIAINDIISSIDQLEGELTILSSVGDAFSSLYEILSKDSTDFANFQRAMALFQIAIDSAQAVSAAIRIGVSSSTNPIQAAVQIASTIALVLANIAKAKAIVEGAQVPALAEGDVNIKGPGTKKSDSIAARLSRGESVITADGTTLDPDLLRAMNKGESEFLKHIQVNYVWPYMEQVIKAHSKAEARAIGFNDRNILKRLDTGNKLQIKTTQALINTLNKKQSKRRYWS